MIKFRNIIYIAIILSVNFAFCILAEASVVKVGMPKIATEDTAYNNYMSDYLQEISYYTGWEYEFVTVDGSSNDQLLNLMQMLQAGTIDILGGIVYNETTAEMFDFPEFSSGNAYSILSVSATDAKFDDMNYATFDKMRVGVLKTAHENLKNAKKFFHTYDTTPIVTLFDTKEDIRQALASGQIDAILSNDFWVEKDQRILARFNGKPYYFVTTKGNLRILNGLNTSLVKINDINPDFSTILYRKHFRYAVTFPFYMTQKEKLYAESSPTIKVVTQPDWAPLYSINPENGQFDGVLKNILDYISKQSGLRFEIIPTKTYEESIDKIVTGQADIFVGAMTNTGFFNDNSLSMSAEIMSLQMLTVQNKTGTEQERNQRILALPYNYLYPEPYPQENIRRYETISECIEAVSSGQADFCYGSSLAIEYAIRNQYYGNIALVSSTSNSEALRMAFSKEAPVELLTITNKAILSLPKEKIQEFIDKKFFADQRKITLQALVRNNPTWFAKIITLVAIFIVVAVIAIAISKIRYNKNLALNNERYRLLSDLSNEYIYEYDYINDTLTVSDKFMHLCKCPIKIYEFLTKNHENLLGHDFALSLRGNDTTSDFSLKVLGKQLWMRNTCSTILNANNLPIRRIGKLLDITAEKHEKDGLMNQAKRDSLTNIFNKGTAESMSNDHLQNCYPDEMSLLTLFDVDDFKFVNDNFGHLFGDIVLKDIAKTLQSNCSNCDIAGRIGGDEFMVLFKNVTEQSIQARLIHIGKMLRVYYPENNYTVGISMGSVLISGKETYAEAMHRADLALYKSKALGKNRHFLYAPELENEKSGQ